MKIFVAGATGAIGPVLVSELLRQGHSVVGMSHSESGSAQLRDLGADAVIADALDDSAVEAALRASGAEVVIDELTRLPNDPSEMASYAVWMTT